MSFLVPSTVSSVRFPPTFDDLPVSQSVSTLRQHLSENKNKITRENENQEQHKRWRRITKNFLNDYYSLFSNFMLD